MGYGQVELEWPSVVQTYFDVVSFVNLNFDLSSPECATVTDDVWLVKWWVTVLLPLLAIIPFGIVIVIALLMSKFTNKMSITPASLLDAARRAYLQLLVLLYLPLAAMATSYMACRKDKNGRWVLEASPSKSCYGTWYWNYFGPAVFFSVGYTVGIPAMVFYVLSKLRKRVDPDLFSLKFAFLVGRFTPADFRFEVWIMARKAAVVMAMTFFRSPLTKANIAILMLVGSFVQLTRFRPYLSAFHNWLAMLCLSSCIAILWAGTFEEKEPRNIGAISGMVINVLAIVVGNAIDLYLIFVREKEAEKMFMEEEDGEFNEMDDFGVVGSFATFDDIALDVVGVSTIVPPQQTSSVGVYENPVFMEGHGSGSDAVMVSVDDRLSSVVVDDRLSSVAMLGSLDSGPPPPPSGLPPTSSESGGSGSSSSSSSS